MSAPVLVTGTAGGVGAVAIAILRHRGFQVTASTGRPEQANHLKGLGGDRHHRTQRARKTAGKRALGGRHDAANSTTLANVLSMTRYGGTVDWRAAWICRPRSRRLSCVLLRFSAADRRMAWQRLASDLDRGKLAAMTRKIGRAEVIEAALDIVEGRVRGRIVVNIR